jgi:hypothetical protein
MKPPIPPCEHRHLRLREPCGCKDAVRHPRLPAARDVLAAEIGRVEAMGVRITCGHTVTDLDAERAGFDAMVPGERRVTGRDRARQEGRRHIDAWLRGERHAAPARHEQAGFGLLHPWSFGDASASEQPERPAASRVADFAEVTGG